MKFNYYFLRIPRYLDDNIFDCPIAYCMEKYNVTDKLQYIPRPFRCGTCKYVACIPTHIAETFTKVMTTHEYSECDYMRTEDYPDCDYSDAYVVEIRERVLGQIVIEYILTRSV